MLDVTVWSDYLCPWCYLGQARANRLAEVHGASVTWMPYELHPNIPAGGRSTRSVYGRGDDDAAAKALGRFAALADEEGLPFEPPSRVRPTRLAHEAALSVRAIAPDAFDRYHAALFDAIWVDELDIEDAEALLDLAVSVGADRTDVDRELASGRQSGGLADSVAVARENGITGTPGFLFDGTFAVVGLQPVEFFDRVASRMGRRS